MKWQDILEEIRKNYSPEDRYEHVIKIGENPSYSKKHRLSESILTYEYTIDWGYEEAGRASMELISIDLYDFWCEFVETTCRLHKAAKK